LTDPQRTVYPQSGHILAAWLSGQDVGLWWADFPSSTPDLWLTRDRCGSTNHAYSAFHPSEVGK